jgi:LDH2 family malate/lactate/ureidoglycolate dehydrogenase
MSLNSKYKVIPAKELYNFCVNCFIKCGTPKHQAEIIAEHLITANLRGVDSHGVIRIPYYIEGMNKGLIKAKAKIKVVKESSITALINGGKGLGIIVADKATEIAINKAKASNVGIVGAYNLGHVGMLAYYTKKIVKHKLIGFACANTAAIVAPYGGKERILGTNPLSIAFPVNEEKSIVIDMATCTMAAFKIHLAMREDKKIPFNVALDKEGKPTTDPKSALEGVLLPFGGYKGYALSLAIEILLSAFMGAPLSKNVFLHASTQGGFLVIALNTSIFRSYKEYKKDISQIINLLKNCKTIEGVEEVLLPGELEERTYNKRLEKGIPLDIETRNELLNIAKRFNITPPQNLF